MQTLMPLADTDRTECGSKPVQVFMFCTRFVIVPSVSRPPVAAVWRATSEGEQVLPEVELDQHRAAQKPGTHACSRERGEGTAELPAIGATAPVGLAGDLVHGHPHRLGHDDRAEHQDLRGQAELQASILGRPHHGRLRLDVEMLLASGLQPARHGPRRRWQLFHRSDHPRFELLCVSGIALAQRLAILRLIGHFDELGSLLGLNLRPREITR